MCCLSLSLSLSHTHTHTHVPVVCGEEDECVVDEARVLECVYDVSHCRVQLQQSVSKGPSEGLPSGPHPRILGVVGMLQGGGGGVKHRQTLNIMQVNNLL